MAGRGIDRAAPLPLKPSLSPSPPSIRSIDERLLCQGQTHPSPGDGGVLYPPLLLALSRGLRPCSADVCGDVRLLLLLLLPMDGKLLLGPFTPPFRGSIDPPLCVFSPNACCSAKPE